MPVLILLILLIPLFLFFTPLGLVLTLPVLVVQMALEPKPEKVAQSGLPIVQAISDYQSDCGLLPYKLSDLVPKYMASVDGPNYKNGWSWYAGQWASLEHRGGAPHTSVRYWFKGYSPGTWQYRPDGPRERQLQVPGPVPRPNRLSDQALFAAQIAERERRITSEPHNLQLYSDKINALALANATNELRAECVRDVKLFPDWWLPRMALASLKDATADERAEFEAWTRRHDTFDSYAYLARFYRDKGNTQTALNALHDGAEKSVERQPNDSPSPSTLLLYDACKFAYDNRDYELAIALSRHWRPSADATGDDSLPALKTAAEVALGRFPEAIDHAKILVKAGPSERTQALLQAAEAHNTNFVYVVEEPDPPWSLHSEPEF